jgi:formate hydrogenlyase subunit 6/NADH:ubiquinone oxidoreductase subunit I
MADKDIYKKLAGHFRFMGMPIPTSEEFTETLRLNLTPVEAEVLLALPNRVAPQDYVAIDDLPQVPGMSKQEMTEILDRVSEKAIVFTGKTEKGEKGYSLFQFGFGYSQAFFWKGEDTPHTRKMAELRNKHGKNPDVLRENIANFEGTKPFRYIPVGKSVPFDKQAVFPQHMMEEVVKNSSAFALAHCPCRVIYNITGDGCDHPLEVCLKFNEAAEFLIEKGFAKQITAEEALDVIRLSEEEGLVHFVDNAGENIQHNCNCCGCACWNVGPIRQRQVPRDLIMATYFIRSTDEEECIGCGACMDICPVDAVKMEEDLPQVDMDWCIGCGVCTVKCPSDAITMEPRDDRTGELPAENFKGLHEIILKERNYE